MNKNINYYNTLGIRNNATAKEIKLAYYKISKESHPDLGGNESDFMEITEAYKILSNKIDKLEYDSKSKYGNNYCEFNEIYDFEFNNEAKVFDRNKYNDFIKLDQLNILVYIDDTFDGTVEYERWIYCKDCKGSGTESGKMSIKDENGNITFMDISEPCDFCINGKINDIITCPYCVGTGMSNWVQCKSCLGEKRTLGRQKLSKIVFPIEQHFLKIEQMGNVSRDAHNRVGNLILLKK